MIKYTHICTKGTNMLEKKIFVRNTYLYFFCKKDMGYYSFKKSYVHICTPTPMFSVLMRPTKGTVRLTIACILFTIQIQF